MVVSYDLKKGRKLVSFVSSSEEETELIDKWISFIKAWQLTIVKNSCIVQIFIEHI